MILSSCDVCSLLSLRVNCESANAVLGVILKQNWNYFTEKWKTKAFEEMARKK
jgi:hypothetical protein